MVFVVVVDMVAEADIGDLSLFPDAVARPDGPIGVVCEVDTYRKSLTVLCRQL